MRIQSRKFIAWIITCIFCIAAVLYTKQVQPELINMYGLITMMYIGGNSFKHYLDNKKEQ